MAHPCGGWYRPTNVTNEQSLNVCPGRLLTDSIQRHKVTPASHSIGVGWPIKLEGRKSLVDILSHLRGAAFDIWGGGGPRKKKFVENVVRKKSLLSKLMRNMLTIKTTKW